MSDDVEAKNGSQSTHTPLFRTMQIRLDAWEFNNRKSYDADL